MSIDNGNADVFSTHRYSISATKPSASLSKPSSAAVRRRTKTIQNVVHHSRADQADESKDDSVHILRSQLRYDHLETYKPRLSSKLYQAFNDAYVPFRDGEEIPENALRKLQTYTLTSPEFYALVTDRELAGGNHIYLDNGRIIFDTYTQPPHAEIIGNIVIQVASRNRNPNLFDVGTGGSMSTCNSADDIDVNMVPGSDKQPDGHWTINPAMLPNPPPAGTFPMNLATTFLSPQIVLEVAVSHQSMTTLSQVDPAKYFAPGTGTRVWIGVKVFKSKAMVPMHCWWMGYAVRPRIGGVFLDQGDMNIEGMPLANPNESIHQPTGRVFHLDVGDIIYPCAPPPTYPATLDINLEEIRQLIVRYMR
jgi:hypothetical protein